MWWFYTVILGMSFGQVLQELAIGVREWARADISDRRPFLPAMLWQVFLLALVVQVWLAVTYYRDTVEVVSILELLAFLAVPAGILVMSFLLPESRWDSASSPAATFARVRPIFFGVLIAMVAVNLLHSFLIGHQGFDLDLVFQCLIIVGAVIGLVIRSSAADSLLAAAMTLVVLTYIGLGYSTVQVGSEAAAVNQFF
ncbi:MAG: hypothetical protein KIH64_006430 [Mycobacterium sp.]|nr:hypothetical protein [Mycobacterium sp.]